MKTLIAGWAGTGKSTLAQSLQSKGFAAIDANTIEGLATWRNRASEESVVVDYDQGVNLTKLAWVWDKNILLTLLDENSDLILCGNASNIWDFIAEFDVLVALNVDETVQRQRIVSQTNNPYGKHPDDLDQIILAQRAFINQATTVGAIIIDANQPIQSVADIILSEIRP